MTIKTFYAGCMFNTDLYCYCHALSVITFYGHLVTYTIYHNYYSFVPENT